MNTTTTSTKKDKILRLRISQTLLEQFGMQTEKDRTTKSKMVRELINYYIMGAETKA